jgi:hypothetical protein
MRIGCGHIAIPLLGNPPWAPTNIAGAVLWLRADLGITLNGADVSAWADQSASNVDALQGTAADQPLYRATGWSNGLPTVDFDRANTEWMQIDSLAAFGSHTCFAVIDQRSETTTLQGLLVDNGGGEGIYAVGDIARMSYVDVGAWDNASAAAIAGQQQLMWSADQSGNVEAFRRNRASLGTGIYTAADNVWGPTLFLGKYSSGLQHHLDAEVAEIILYNRVLTAAEITQVEAYLGGRYGL